MTWDAVTLGDLLVLKRGYDLPTKARMPGNFPVVSSSGITGRHAQSKVSPPGVVTGRYGTLGQVFFLQEPFWPLNTTLYVKDFKANDPRWVSYLLQTLSFGSRSGAAAVPGVNRNALHMLPVQRPPLREQKAIAAVLAAYDALIENTLRRIETLEEMTQAVYREWFVNLRIPGRRSDDCHIDDGQLPGGWTRMAPIDFLEHHIGGGWGKEMPSDDESELASVIRGTDMPRVRLLDTETCPKRFHKPTSLTSRLLKPGDVVMEVSGGSDTYPVGRSVLISPQLLEGLGGAICASFCKLLRVRRKVLCPELFFLQMQDMYQRRDLREYEVRSTGITNFKFKPFIEQHQFFVPPQEIQDAFLSMTKPFFELTQVLGSAVQNLRTTRDFLLPKLISGEIDVSELDIDMSWLAA